MLTKPYSKDCKSSEEKPTMESELRCKNCAFKVYAVRVSRDDGAV
jgi:DNA-directed RNA polymerase subunit RPC12/RpoP